MINQIETQYSSNQSDNEAEEKRKQVQHIVKANIKRETAEEKIKNMLATNWIKATDVHFKEREKQDYLKTQRNSSPNRSVHLKNSLSMPTFENDIGFVAA